MKYQLSCESTVDLPYAYVSGRGLSVLFYTYEIDGVPYEDNMGRDKKDLARFYAALDAGKLPVTSQINEFTYEKYFDALLEQGDVLHLNFGSGMTPSVNNARLAAETVLKRHPGRRLEIVDSLCSSSGYGLFVDTCADLWEQGMDLDELKAWAEAHANQVHHQFYTTDMKFFRRSGRVSGAAATLATVLSICPIMHLNDEGRIIAYDKVRGKKNALQRTVDEMAAHAQNGTDYDGRCFISHANALEQAKLTRDAIEARFPKLKGKVQLFDIGNIIASHCGPGTVAVYFWGDERTH